MLNLITSSRAPARGRSWALSLAAALVAAPLPVHAQDVGANEQAAAPLEQRAGSEPGEAARGEEVVEPEREPPSGAAEDETGDAWPDDTGDDSGGGAFGDEPKFAANGMMRVQGGVFVPLISDGFKAHENEAYIGRRDGQNLEYLYDQPCDPIAQPHRPCYPVDHGQDPGSLSIARATLLLEAHWQPTDRIGVHAIVRGVRSLELEGDDYAHPPDVIEAFDGAQRRAYSRDWVHDNYYTEFDLREFYLDLSPTDWLALRLGRQQVAWGETNSFRLLDVVNPTDNTWHFGPLESFEDTRIPLWMALVTLDLPALDGALELLWVPLLDEPRDTVTVPLSFPGAWGLPYSNAPTSFFVPRTRFEYPGGELSDSRVGARWKGTLGSNASYSLVYYYTHQIGLPIPIYYIDGGLNEQGVQVLDRFVLNFPRNHVAGATFEYAFDSPIGTLLRLEASVEPDHVVPSRTDSGFTPDPVDVSRYNYHPKEKLGVNYAVSLQRSTMLRFLNPTQSFLMFAQFSHSMLPTLDIKGEDFQLAAVPLYNEWKAQKHSLAVIGMIQTAYMYGMITPRITGAWLPNLYAGDSGFYSVEVEFRLATNYRLNLRATDFIGKDAYRELGLFRDRDELHGALTVQF